ncbi:N-acetylglucosamine kinase [Streptomyces sp. SP18CS02]|uniref:N-acetylglucosamine kinase n=1 Tax=Streptomyces sp. SP18CS02 TaxID=3002531 RepID=UPI002E77A037|nr:BadF/BadG/BcrA/BcrD ATPase family protein [Streptomyces sp. SP18CS02]MEE1755364.1 BadF/BadG/BcrA/BcrD ATPase family protein [Streptomyces sp. SP18CS02]
MTPRPGPGTSGHGVPGPWVLGVDSGGSGLRIALARTGPGTAPGRAEPAVAAGEAVPAGGAPEAVEVVTFGEPVPTGPGGIDAGRLLERLLPAAEGLLARAGAGAVAAVAVGAAGMATLGDDLRARLPAALKGALGVDRVALAADAVTAYAGALGQRRGVVVAAGTGVIALGTDLARWRRADGWGHLLGDCGSGAWIGRAGLEAALRAHDGRRGGSAALLARAEAVFGPPAGLPGRLYPRTDRPAVLASFAPEVAACSGGDPVARDILARAARHIAEAAAAVCPPGEGREIALTGGLFRMGEPLLVPLRAELAEQLPLARPVSAGGDPLTGALTVAAGLATDTLRLPSEPGMLDTAGL